MANKIKFECLATGIGTLPDADPQEACRRVFSHLADVPFWPQLPKRSPLENMYLQFSEGFPGATIEGDKLFAEKSGNYDDALERLYRAYLDNRPDEFSVSPDYAAGLHAMLSYRENTLPLLKGHVTGPISWGLAVTDRQQRGIIYDEEFGDAVARFLRLKAAWQEKTLKKAARETIIFVDEPYLTSLGSAFVSIPRERVINLIGEVLCGIDGVSGIHCCGSADWSLLLELPVDIINFDAYNYAQSLGLYAENVKAFLKRGGTIAWGIVPNDEEILPRESPASLYDRLGEAIAPFTRNGVTYRQILEQSLLTPSCGLGTLSPQAADEALAMLSRLSRRMRQKL